MKDVLKTLLKQPYWVISLLVGAVFVVLPCIKIENRNLVVQPPTTFWLLTLGIVLVALSWIAFGYTLLSRPTANAGEVGTGLDLTRVKESNGVLSTTVAGCKIQVIEGRIEQQSRIDGTVIVLPCNEYFDDFCVGDTKSALGAYVNQTFAGQVEAFTSLMQAECRKKLGQPVQRQKTDDQLADSFGPGRCLLLINPLGHPIQVALVSTTTQRAGEGLAARISYLFDGMGELFTRLADARLDTVAMPILGAGHGRIDPPLALVGLLSALAEAARYGQGGQRPKKVTIVVFKPDTGAMAEVDSFVVRRALALIGSGD